MLLIDQLPPKKIEKWCDYCNKTHTDLLDVKDETPDTAILFLIEEYEATKLLLIEEEHKLETLPLEYNNKILIRKTQLQEEGYKATESKERAQYELTEEKQKLIKLEKQIAILKANIHSIEYKLRWQFNQGGSAY